MSNDFMFDIETLGVDSTSIVLSAGIIYFNLEEQFNFNDLVARSLFVKFEVTEQRLKKRSLTPSTLQWWQDQSKAAKELSLYPAPEDLGAAEGIAQLKKYIKEHGSDKSMFWARGSLDQMCIDSLCRSFDLDPIANYNNWMDVRTAIRCLKETATSRGYCTVPGFDQDLVDAHNPVADCARDIMLVRYGV